MTRDEVLKEFYATPAVPGGSSDRMADEIVRLRKQFEIATSMLSSQARMINELQDTLDRLREPSEKVLLAAVEAVPYGALYAALTRCIHAAVAAAKQEVANGHV